MRDTFSMITIAMALSGMLSKHLKKQGHLKHLKNKQKNILLRGPYQQFTPTSQKSEQQDNPFQQKLAAFCDKGLISCVVMTPKQKWDESQWEYMLSILDSTPSQDPRDTSKHHHQKCVGLTFSQLSFYVNYQGCAFRPGKSSRFQ